MTGQATPEVAALSIPSSPGDLWTAHRADSPLIATAIHNGHGMRAEVASRLALSDEGRLREEDPFTEFVMRDVPNRIVFHRSRFEVDLNRARGEAVYLTPGQAWGLDVWKDMPPEAMVERSLSLHDGYYAMLKDFLAGIARDHGSFVLLDMHSYNHRRNGADAPPTSDSDAPVINIGTFSMDRARWADIVDPFMESLRSCSVQGTALDVRENVAFQGKGEQTRFVHEHFPKSGCAIAVEFKKVFMDEWTGQPDRTALMSLRQAVTQALPVLLDSLKAHA